MAIAWLLDIPECFRKDSAMAASVPAARIAFPCARICCLCALAPSPLLVYADQFTGKVVGIATAIPSACCAKEKP
jgi:hypothetical protein